MAGKREVGFLKTNVGNLKEQLLRTTLRNVRSQGHPYVELREDGKKLIFFCSLCLAPCYSDSILFNHLKGNSHTERLAAAQITLLKPNPWPFSDGMIFFHDDSDKNDKTSPVTGLEKKKFLSTHHMDGDSLALIEYHENGGPNGDANVPNENKNLDDSNESGLSTEGSVQELVVPSVLRKNEASDLVVRHMGAGLIGARYGAMDEVTNGIHKIWCEWLGNKEFVTEDIQEVPEHDFAVVTFGYNYNLGRSELFNGFRYLLPSSTCSEAEDSGNTRVKKRKSFSDPEDISEPLINRDDSSSEDSPSSISKIVSGNDDQLVHSRILSSKTLRKQLRKQQRVASERSCDICQQKMRPNKDVAALLNRKTGKLVCSSRNLTGAFHLFHISCLIHWILVCEVEIYGKQSTQPKPKRRSRRKTKRKYTKPSKKQDVQEKQTESAFCPECQGTGATIDGQELEKPTVPLSEIFKYKIKICDAHKAWMKSPESLPNCSIGFNFSPDSKDTFEGDIKPLKLLQFYRANE